jgi:hypothetical protein
MIEETSSDPDPQPSGSQEDPFVVFELPTVNGASATIRSTAVWLVNQSTQPMIVTAAGGAESVVVDTVGAADSVLVSIDTRAPTIELTARTAVGALLGFITLSMDSAPKRAAFPH